MKKFTHLDDEGQVRQVPVQHKDVVQRRATATGMIRLASETMTRIESNQIAKGNVLAVARIAGIVASKRTAELIPLCHSLLLEHVSVDFQIQEEGIEVTASAVTSAKTGVEMEALVAVSTALLTIYDMCKAIDQTMSFEGVHLVEKTKGEVLTC